MNEQIPLYVGIPLAMLCIAVCAAAIVFAVTMWRGR